MLQTKIFENIYISLKSNKMATADLIFIKERSFILSVNYLKYDYTFIINVTSLYFIQV